MIAGDRRERDARGIKDASYHLLLLAKNNNGYQNLLKLASIAYLEGFYYRPRIDKEILSQYRGGLICTSACLKGELSQSFLRGDVRAAEEIADFYAGLFGSDYFIELHD